jgi:hypothetical protein
MEKSNYEGINIKDAIEKCYIVATLANEMLTRGCEIAENYPNVNMEADSTSIAIMINDIRNTLCEKMNEISTFLQDIDDIKRLFPINADKCEKEIIQNIALPSISEEFTDEWTYQMIINRKGLGYDRILIPSIRKISFPIYANDISATMDDIAKNQVINGKLLPINFLNWIKNKHKDDDRRIALYNIYKDYLGDVDIMCRYVRVTIVIEYRHHIVFTLKVYNLMNNNIKDVSVIPDFIYDNMN